MRRTGRIKTPSSLKYTWYEHHGTDKAEKGQNGGWIAIGVLNCLEPSWISEGDDDVEALNIEVWLEAFPIRLVCGYGPQEGDRKERTISFGNIYIMKPKKLIRMEPVLYCRWLEISGWVKK